MNSTKVTCNPEIYGYALRKEQVYGEEKMLCTITIGSCVSIQGMFVKALANGRMRIRVGDKFYDGFAIGTMQAA